MEWFFVPWFGAGFIGCMVGFFGVGFSTPKWDIRIAAAAVCGFYGLALGFVPSAIIAGVALLARLAS
jgi:hypothetical protein